MIKFNKGLVSAPNKLNSSPKMQTTYKLSADQLQFYRDNGYLVIKKFIDYTDLDKCKQYFIEACNGEVNIDHMAIVKEKSLVTKCANKEDYIYKVQDIHFDKVLMTFTDHPRLLDVVRQFIGDEITVVHSIFINKPPGSAGHTAHQDLHYMPHRPVDKIVAAWTAIDQARIDNGGLWVVPGSHRANALYEHERRPGMTMLYRIKDESLASLDKRVHLEMSPGDTVFIHSLLIHGSGTNNSKDHRKSMIAHYVNSHCECVDLRGATQDVYVQDLEKWQRSLGHDVDFMGYWRLKSKKLGGKSKL